MKSALSPNLVRLAHSHLASIHPARAMPSPACATRLASYFAPHRSSWAPAAIKSPPTCRRLDDISTLIQEGEIDLGSKAAAGGSSGGSGATLAPQCASYTASTPLSSATKTEGTLHKAPSRRAAATAAHATAAFPARAARALSSAQRSAPAARKGASSAPDVEPSPPTVEADVMSEAGAMPSAPPPDSPSRIAEVGADGEVRDWYSSFHGMAQQAFPQEIRGVLEAPLDLEDVEIKPDGLLYLPEIKYRRILNRAFGPGGWGLAPRSETNVGNRVVSREWALICQGRFVSTARGEQEYFDPAGVATASEGAKSNALMRCCKDLGIAHELWDPRFIRNFKKSHCVEVFTEHAGTGKKRKLWRRKDAPPFDYPHKELK